MARREAVFPAHSDFMRAAPTRAQMPAAPPLNVALLRFALPRAAEATVAVFDATGKRVRVLLSGELANGEHACGWDGRDDRDQRAAAGAYVLRLEADGHVLTARRVSIS
jgi:hypothetical protein